MPNPADIMKVLSIKNRFEKNHPKFVAFIKDIAKTGIEEGSVIEVKLIRPDGTETTANMKVQASDVEIVNELKSLR